MKNQTACFECKCRIYLEYNAPQTTEYILVSLNRLCTAERALVPHCGQWHDSVPDEAGSRFSIHLHHITGTIKSASHIKWKWSSFSSTAQNAPSRRRWHWFFLLILWTQCPDRLELNDEYNPKYSEISTFHLVKVNFKFSLYNRLNQKIINIFGLYSLNLKIHDCSLLISPNFYPFTHISISY